ncbi:ATP-binding cassette domain-containing protein [Solidesulfovibrio magneticus]|uniref:Molybdenum ABC transporter ATP-binding protein n=1 Tax=Solidesulfovibrio magneticus (strain ATCC 700980 / DSM 13731 / RS-1) TaxID=573370 RepID=C4XQ71_SOLM1|nr:ATP-binding cassette domain-containing protein [Solidesulfovibrio magneticus]BAH75236.1 molybdenum ABC transporter ATP-binding protein [Solidesulfovibrio magneticus RS-1]
MRIVVDIQKTYCCGGREFHLDAAFAVSGNRAVLFGASGSGKTLTLRALAGLLRPDSGSISVDGRVFFDSAQDVFVPPRLRRIGYVFQDYALFPHLTVRQNVAFGLSPLTGRLTPQAAEHVQKTLALFGIEGLADLRPARISGGQRQRVALARALVCEPGALLLDEPFSALDIPLRQKVRAELAGILSRLDIPLIMVTHDPADVAFFGGEVVRYGEGRVIDMHSAEDMRRSMVKVA